MDLVWFLMGSAWILHGARNRGGGGEGEEGEGEGEGGQQNWSYGKKLSTIAMPGAGLLLLFWGLQRG